MGFVAFTWPNFCLLDLSLLFIVLVGRNVVSGICKIKPKQEAQLMLTTGSTRLAVSRGQQTWYHFRSIATFR